MNGSRYPQAGAAPGDSKRVPRPFDQADIDGEPVENASADNVPFFIPARVTGSLLDNDGNLRPAGTGADAITDGRYGDVAASSFGDDTERERDA